MKNDEILNYIDSMQIDEKQKRIPSVDKNLDEDVVKWDEEETKKKPKKGTTKKIDTEFMDELFTDDKKEEIKEENNEEVVEKHEESKVNIPEKITQENLEEFLKKFYEEQRKELDSYQKKNVSITDLVGCVRKTYFDFKNVERRPSYIYPYNEIVTEIGNVVHQVLQKRIPCINKEEKMKLTEEFSFPISFRMDIHLNQNTLIEIKTIDTLPDKPKKEHAKQAILYAYFLNKYRGYNFNLVQLLYISRGKVKSKIFDIEINESILMKAENMVKGYLETLKEHLDMNVPPPLTNKYVDKSQCFFCDYNYICDSKQKYKSYSSMTRRN